MQPNRGLENLTKWLPQDWELSGQYGIPRIRPQELPFVDEFVPFADLSKKFTKGQGVQMFVDDYRLERLWQRPDKYLEPLQRAGVVFSPDFSLYTDMPRILQLYSHYKKHWLAAYWQRNSITVIPTICWSDEKSFDFCFDGEPKENTVAVSSVGTQRGAETKAAFLLGYDAMMERLQPETVLFFGNIPKECKGNICPVQTFYKRFEKGEEKHA